MNTVKSVSVAFVILSVGLHLELCVAFYNPSASSYSHWRNVFKGDNKPVSRGAAAAPTSEETRNTLDDSALEMAAPSIDSSDKEAGSGLDLGFKRNHSGARIAFHRQALERASSAFVPGRKRRSLMRS